MLIPIDNVIEFYDKWRYIVVGFVKALASLVCHDYCKEAKSKYRQEDYIILFISE